MAKRILGADLKSGDILTVWWGNHRDMIVCLQPYRGPLAHVFPHGAQIAGFAISPAGMTIDNGAFYEIAA